MPERAREVGLSRQDSEVSSSSDKARRTILAELNEDLSNAERRAKPKRSEAEKAS